MAKFEKVVSTIGQYIFYCPGCNVYHCVWTANEGYPHPVWDYNGDVERPTISPSLLVRWRHPKGYSNENPAPIGYDGPIVDEICHMFIKDGMIQYLSDCTHELAGKTIELPELDDEIE
jgi:hypothetical protein